MGETLGAALEEGGCIMALARIVPKMHNVDVKPPQLWIINEDLKKLLKIDMDHVISFTPEGKPLTFYKDDMWDLSPYGGNGIRKQKIYFNKIVSHDDRELSKRILFIVLMLTKGKDGLVKAPTTLWEFYTKALVYMHEYAYEHSLQMKQILEDKRLLKGYIEYLEDNRAYIILQVINLLTLLKSYTQNVTNVNYQYDEEVEERASRIARVSVDGHKHTACIPVSILLESTRQRWEHIDKAIAVLPKLLKLINLLLIEPTNYRALTSPEAKWAKKEGILFVSFKEVVNSLGLNKFFKFYNIKGRDTLQNYLIRLQITSKHLIHTFTGMRHDEAMRLMIGCYSAKGASTHPTITSTEKKGAKVLLKHSFVTIKGIRKVIDLNQKITKAIMKHRFPDLKYFPLMINARLLVGDKKNWNQKHIMYNGRGSELALSAETITITTIHMEEVLKVVDPYRDWDHDKVYQVGKQWKFTYQQYRRSMAVYGLGSGLVSSSALGRQFKHFFNSTTAHYGNGSFVASPIDGTDDKNNIKQFLNEERYELDALALQRDLLFNIKKLQGPKSSFALDESKMQSIEPDDIVIDKENVKTIAKRLKSGAQFYKSTALGSCMSIEPCDGNLMLLYVGCIGCINADINDKKLINTIEGHREFGKFLEEKMPIRLKLEQIKWNLKK